MFSNKVNFILVCHVDIETAMISLGEHQPLYTVRSPTQYCYIRMRKVPPTSSEARHTLRHRISFR